MQRFVILLQYLGTRYAGWQRQENARGIQQVVEEAFARVCGTSVAVTASGRTDAGVHARALPLHADIPIRIDGRGLVLAVNGHLPDDIRALMAREAPADFHARFDAVRKTYAYRIWNAPVADVFHAATHAHVAMPLDSAAMEAAAALLVGQHDFRSFTVPEPEVSSTSRRLERLDVRRFGATVEITATADGFLRYMVRRMAGLLIEVGRGKLASDHVRQTIEPAFATSRWTAPASGLTLEEVDFGGRIEPLIPHV